MALTTSGRLYAWGDDGEGQLGDGQPHAMSASPVLVRIPPDLTVRAVSAGGSHTLALTSVGLLMSWGSNTSGQLGNGSRFGARTPSPVLLAGRQVTAISAGDNFSLALTGNGRVLMAWGANTSGQLGDGTIANRFTPVPVRPFVSPGATITAISAGDDFSLALTSDNVLESWGRNLHGQLGNASHAPSDVPVAVKLPGRAILGQPPVTITVSGIGAGPATFNGYLITPSLVGI